MKCTITNAIINMLKISFKLMLILMISLNIALAREGNAQVKSIKEVVVDIDLQSTPLRDIFKEIEKKTSYSFTFSKERIDLRQQLTLSHQNSTVETVLLDISRQARLKFRQVNKNIGVYNYTSSHAPEVKVEIAEAFPLTGRVTDEEGNGLPGASILKKGTTDGTITDIDGNFNLEVNEGDVLVVSFVGYQPQEITVGSERTLNISLVTDVSALEEIVVIGYGQVEKKEITSSVVSVDVEDFNKGNVYDPVQFLQGKVPGLSIVKPGADPNAGFDVRLRGLSTFGSNSSPLIVVDGVLGGSLQTLDPNEIESIDVLKDGSAAAIYGTRGSSGVIIVTTKKGKYDANGVEYNTYLSFEEIARSVDIATREEFIEYGGTDLGFDTEWVDEVTRTGISQSHNLAVYGGSGASNYRLSVNYRDVEGIAVGSGFDQINSRLNMNHTALNSKLSIQTNLSANLRRASFVPYEAQRFALISNPTAPVYVDGDPSLGYFEPNTTEFHNPVSIAQEVTDDGKYKTMLASIKADYEILNGLFISGFYSLQYESDVRSQYYSSRLRWGDHPNGRATKFTEDRSTQLFEVTGSFKRSFGDLSLNFVAGHSYQKFLFENFGAYNSQFLTDELLYNNLGFGTAINSGNTTYAGVNSNKGEWLLASFFGRAIMNYQDTYFMTVAYRKEGSSRFGPNERWGDFYSISGGVDVTRLINLPFDLLKARVGYGVTGNLPEELYAYKTRLSGGSGDLVNFNDNPVRLYNYVSNPNPDLKWEEKTELNAGIDFSLLEGRLNGSVDYYTRTSTDILFSQPVSQPPNFYSNTLLNLGELKSNGFELGLNYSVFTTPDLTWNTGITYFTNKTEIVELNGESVILRGGNPGPPGLNNESTVRAEVGQELGLLVAPIFEGLDENGERIIRPLEDRNEDGSIDQDDYPVVGNALPDFELAWNNSLSFRGFDLSFTFRGAFGHSLVNVNRAYYEVPANINNYNLVVTEYFLPEMQGNEEWHDYYVEKADYLKLDNMSLGYNFNLGDSPIKKLRLYVSGQNLFVITDYTGVDPEVHYGNDPLFPGVEDRNSYFRSRTYTVGLNLGF